MSSGIAARNIWVISDTHLKSEKNLPAEFVSRVSREDLIIHLGDFISSKVVDFLNNIASLKAVSGNCDPPEVKRLFPPTMIVNLGGLKVGLMHGSGGQSETINRALRDFEGKVDIAMFGHTHTPCHFRSGNTLFFNPGSLTEGRGNPTGYGLLHLDDEIWVEMFET